MVSDLSRMRLYRTALGRVVRPGSVVADIGTGLGVFALIAVRLGARRVYAIDPAAAIEVGREIARKNGVEDQIEFIPEISTRVSLPELVDVVVSDLRGVLPLYGEAVHALIDARDRLLTDGGKMIPSRDTMYAALVEAQDLYPTVATDADLGLDISAAERFAVNTPITTWIEGDKLLVAPQAWSTLDYGTVTSADVRGHVSWVAARDGVAHGLCVWFDGELIDGVELSNAPGNSKTVYKHSFFPLATPVSLVKGDGIEVEIEARLVGDSYVWRWITEVTDGQKASSPKAAFEQSTLTATPLSPSRLQRREARHVAALNENGEIDLQVLTWIDGATALTDIADRLASRFPHRFPSREDALRRVAALSAVYSR